MTSDVLREIFSYAIAEDEFMVAPLRLSHVCQQWRSILQNSPLLWTKLAITIVNDISPRETILTKHFLTISQTCRLSLLVRAACPKSDRSLTNLIEQLLRGHWHRVDRLELRGDIDASAMFWDMGHMWCSSNLTGGRLLFTHLERPHPPILDLTVRPHIAPSSVWSPKCKPPAVLNASMYVVLNTSLSHVTWGWDSFEWLADWFQPRDCHQFLECLSLKIAPVDFHLLRLFNVNPNGKRVKFDRLTSLSLCFEKGTESILPFLDVFDAPNLQTLRLQYATPCDQTSHQPRHGRQPASRQERQFTYPQHRRSQREFESANALFTAISRWTSLKDLRLYGVQYPENPKSVWGCLQKLVQLKTLHLFGDEKTTVVDGFAATFRGYGSHEGDVVNGSGPEASREQPRLLPNLRHFACSHEGLGEPFWEWIRASAAGEAEGDKRTPQLDSLISGQKFLMRALRSAPGCVDLGRQKVLARRVRMWKNVQEKTAPFDLVELLQGMV